MSANGPASAQTMLAFGTWRAGYCLEAVWQAFKRNGAHTDRNAATALIGWEKSDGKHHGDRNPPPGVPVWFGAKASSAAGDVVISLGGGLVVATDWPRNGVIGITTIEARRKQIGRPYLGWTETILGAPIDYGTPAPTPSPDSTKPTPSPARRRRDIMLEATYRTPSLTLAAQARLGGAITFFDDPDEWTAIAMASGMGAWEVSDAKLEQLANRYGRLPAGLYDDGRQPLFILAPEGGGDSRYGALGNRAWPLSSTAHLAALQKAGAAVRIIPQSEIEAALAWQAI